MSLTRRVRAGLWLGARGLVILVAVLAVIVGLLMVFVQTGLGKNQLRALVVRQANQYLTAALSIGRLEGSLFRGLTLSDVVLVRDGVPIVSIEEVSLSYGLAELWQNNQTVIRRLVLTRPRIVAAREPDGRWNLAALVRPNPAPRERSGPRRAIRIQAIELVDANVSFRSPLKFGPADVPTDFTALNIAMSFSSDPGQWTLVFGNASWTGRSPDLTVTRLAGTMGRSTEGWFFDSFSVETPQSAFVLAGQVRVGERPTVLDLHVQSDHFAFQEWSSVLGGLRNLAIEAAFETTLKGSLDQLVTRLTLSGTGGSIDGAFTLNTRVPGWRGVGAVDVAHIDLARWLNQPGRPSDINGHLAFDLDLELGRRFPRGTYAFEGPHVMYLGYSADAFRSQGRLTAGEVLIDRMAAVAYQANLPAVTGSIGLDSPYPYHFQGAMAGLDLRRVPETVPVPRVESALAFDFDVAGRFSQPFIAGRASFAASQFLGATIGEGTVGAIDTASTPFRYSGEGDIEQVDLNRFGEGLGVAWLQEPRYAGMLSGHFRAEGTGGDADTMQLSADGRLARADIFRGSVSDADVSLRIADGSLESSFKGRLMGIDPAVALMDPKLSASLTGSADVQTKVHDLLVRTPTLADYEMGGRLALEQSSVRDVRIDTATTEARLADEKMTMTEFTVSSPALSGTGAGVVSLNGRDPSDFQYNVTQADLAMLQTLLGQRAAGLATTTGRLTGPSAALRAAGEGTFTNLDAFGVTATAMAGEYDVTIPSGTDTAPAQPAARVTGRASGLQMLGQTMTEASGAVTLADDRANFNLTMTHASGRTGDVAGAVLLQPDRQSLDLLSLDLAIGSMPWRLLASDPPPRLSWDEAGVTIAPTTFASGHEDDQRIDVAGTWRYDGDGALRVAARHAFLESLQNTNGAPARYGGVVDLDAVIRGTRDTPIVTGTVTISNGRVERVTYERLTGRIDYSQGLFDVDLRLDQGPDTWLTARGQVPGAVLTRDLPDGEFNIAIESSTIDLALIAGLTDVVTESAGRIRVNLQAIGTRDDPHFEGAIAVSDASFLVAATGVRYTNGRVDLQLARDRIAVEAFHLEDTAGRTLELRGSLGTHELTVGDVSIDITADRFEVLRNEFGRVDLNAMLTLRGQFEAPRLAGRIAINGDALDVDRILDRLLFQPYATEPTTIASLDAVAALNPWDRLGLDVELRVPRTLRLVGTDVQVSSGTPIGIGDINLRVGGDLYLYKDPNQPLYVTGSLDQVSGTYAFQGRRFEIDEAASSINFFGDLDPQIWVTVTREISGVRTEVTLSGSLRQPELRLASTPPLEQSDILSLIIFNATPNSLTAIQQQELAVRAATLAAGFLAQPLLQAVQSELGLEIFEIETGAQSDGAPVLTIGQELAPGLVARFSRQFGQDPWNQASVEYYLSRLFRIRGTFSDAQSITARSAFRRTERAGIDLLLFFSF